MDTAIRDATTSFVTRRTMDVAVQDATEGLVTQDTMNLTIEGAIRESSTVLRADLEPADALILQVLSDATRDFVTRDDMNSAISTATTGVVRQPDLDSAMRNVVTTDTLNTQMRTLETRVSGVESAVTRVGNNTLATRVDLSRDINDLRLRP
jgi:hypothetical protein